MNIKVSEKPCIALETAMMLHGHARRIKYAKLKKRFQNRVQHTMSDDEYDIISASFDILDEIDDEVFNDLSTNIDGYDYFFYESGNDLTGMDALYSYFELGTIMIFPFFDPCISDFEESKASIKATWDYISRTGYTMGRDKNTIYVSVHPGVAMGENYLFEQIDKLPVDQSFRYKLYKAFLTFDKTLDALFDFMRPYAEKLSVQYERKLMPVFEYSVEHWRSVAEDSEEALSKGVIAVMHDMLVSEEAVNNLCFEESTMQVLPVFADSGSSSIIRKINRNTGSGELCMYCGTDIRNNLSQKNIYDTVLDLNEIIRILSDINKMNLVNQLSKKSNYCSALVEEMGLNLGNTSRNLNALAQIGFLTQKKVGNKLYYSTNIETIQRVLNSLGAYLTGKEPY